MAIRSAAQLRGVHYTPSAGARVLRVTDDTDDYGWQFLGSDARAEDAKIISLAEAVELDPSVLQVADLPAGWQARRASLEEPWIREIISDATSTI